MSHWKTLSRKEVQEPPDCYIVGNTQASCRDSHCVTNRAFQTLNIQNPKLRDQGFSFKSR